MYQGLAKARDLTDLRGMALLNFRNLLSLAAGVSASAVAVRKAVGREVDKRTEKAIEEAATEARTEIRARAHKFFTTGFLRFFWTSLIKGALILIVATLFFLELVAHHWSAIGLGALFVVFTTYDAIRAFPTIGFLFREFRKHGWRPKKILAETISAQVFETVMDRAQKTDIKRSESIMLMIAGKKRDDIVERMAKAVAEIAADTSWDDIRPLLVGFAARCAVLFSLYFPLVWTIVWLVRG